MYFFFFAARFIPSRLSTAFAKRNLFSEAAKCKDDDDKCVCVSLCVWGGVVWVFVSGLSLSVQSIWIFYCMHKCHWV